MVTDDGCKHTEMVTEWTKVKLADICETIYRYPSFYGMGVNNHHL